MPSLRVPAMKLMFLADLHLRPKGPPSRKDDYPKTILGKLGECLEFAEEHDFHAVVLAGDVFHHKDPSRTPHWLINDLIDILNCNTPVFVVIGNHDLQPSGHRLLFSQPIGVLINAGAVEHSPRADLGDRTMLTMVDHHNDIEDLFEDLVPNPVDGFTNILVAHAQIGTSELYPTKCVPSRVVASLGYDYVFFGHTHTRVNCDRDGVVIRAIPALARGAIPTDPWTSTPGALAYVDGNVAEFTPHHQRAGEVFRYDLHESKKELESQIKEFVAHAASLSLRGTSIAAALASLQSQVEPHIFELAKEYIDKAA